jgi:hypothetical protein
VGDAVKVTTVLNGNAVEHVAPQLMPAGDVVTVPDPVPAGMTVRVCAGRLAKYAVTDAVPVRVNVVVAKLVLENEPPDPPQLLKT